MELEGIGGVDWLESDDWGEIEGHRRSELREAAPVRGRPPWISSAMLKILGFFAIFVVTEKGLKWLCKKENAPEFQNLLSREREPRRATTGVRIWAESD